MLKKSDYGIFESIRETYKFLQRTHHKQQRHRNSIHWIQPFLPILKNYALRCEHITEFGINQVVSTWAFLDSRPKKLVSIDIDLHNRSTKEVPEFEKVNYWLKSAMELAQAENIEFAVIEGDTTQIEIEETDLLFIDTLHREYHIRKELELHANSVRKYIIFHDTRLFPEINIPINELLDSGDFKKVKEYHKNPGLKIIKRT